MDKNLKAINWEECIKVTNNPELAKELLEMFANELPTFENNIKQAQQTQNRQELARILHKLQGSSSYCGVARLKNIAAELEKRLKADNNLPIDGLLEKLFQEINIIKQELKLVTCE